MITSETRDAEALKIAEEIVATKAHLAVLVERFRRVVGGPAPNGNEPTKVAAQRGGGDGAPAQDSASASASASARIMAVFQRQPGKKVTTQSVVAELPDLDVALVRSTINRFGRTGKLKPVKRGVYKFVPVVNEEDTEG